MLSVAMVYPSRPHDPTITAETEYGHPAHRGFARAITAEDVPLIRPDDSTAPDSLVVSDLVSAMISPIPKRDVYVLENDSVLYLAPRLKAIYPDSTVLLLAAADRLIGDGDVMGAEGHRQRAETERLEALTDRHLLRQFLEHYCDGIIAVSEFVADRIRPHTRPETPIRVVNPYIQPAVYERLRAIEPDLASTTAVTVSQWREHKGMDILVEAWPRVRERHPSAELRIIGPGHPTNYGETPGITVCGYVDDLGTELSNASLYIHPARTEAFGVSVVEAMCAGLPAVVTETTGARVAVSAVDGSLLAAPSPAALARAVSRYFDADIDRRVKLSRWSRRASEPYREDVQTERFRAQFRLLLGSIRRERQAPTNPDGERPGVRSRGPRSIEDR